MCVSTSYYLSTQADVELSIVIFKRLRDARYVPRLREHLDIGVEFYPGPAVDTDEQIEELLRKTLSPVSRATSTCKMGRTDDQRAVVDLSGRAYGTQSCEFSLEWST
ncbi:hypothetical protein F5Y17DRAFT_122554 [Xylariaceae sp. FL0594]|nr:hypothetical protein F5Y17DRAFT_122554 [Xylariaceae sp. FL0594]